MPSESEEKSTRVDITRKKVKSGCGENQTFENVSEMQANFKNLSFSSFTSKRGVKQHKNASGKIINWILFGVTAKRNHYAHIKYSLHWANSMCHNVL